MKLWHDDIRPAPEGWVWARTNAEAIKLLKTGKVEEASLDHDLGYHNISEEQIKADSELLFLAGRSSETGLDLVTWMIDHNTCPPIITIHSWNPSGAHQMAMQLHKAQPGKLQHVIIRPFSLNDEY